MTSESATNHGVRCPSCGNTGKRVSAVTLAALLQDDLAEPFRQAAALSCDGDARGCRSDADDSGWRFCDSPDCDVVYFSENDTSTFTKSQLRVPVGVKESSGERPLCYCFGHSVASIKDELRTKGRSDALADIRARMKDPGCHCETANPSGSCCLGSVARGIEVARRELGMEDDNDNGTNSANAKSGSVRPQRIVWVGTLLSAVMASACCWIPLVLLAAGISGAGIAAKLEAWRPLFAALTVGFLGAAFYFAYRPGKATRPNRDGTQPADGAAESCCAPQSSRGASMQSLNKLLLWSVTLVAAAFLFFPSYAATLFGAAGSQAVTSTMNRAVFRIDGMTCEACAVTVAEAIRNVPGVQAVEVSFEQSRAVVGTAKDTPVPTESILSALRQAGYDGTLVAPPETPAIGSRP